jgi:hypothetical protein
MDTNVVTAINAEKAAITAMVELGRVFFLSFVFLVVSTPMESGTVSTSDIEFRLQI